MFRVRLDSGTIHRTRFLTRSSKIVRLLRMLPKSTDLDLRHFTTSIHHFRRRLRRRTRRHLRAVIDRFAVSPSHVGRRIHFNDIQSRIGRLTRRLKTSIMIVNSHGPSVSARLLNSGTSDIVHRTGLPILIIHWLPRWVSHPTQDRPNETFWYRGGTTEFSPNNWTVTNRSCFFLYDFNTGRMIGDARENFNAFTDNSSSLLMQGHHAIAHYRCTFSINFTFHVGSGLARTIAFSYTFRPINIQRRAGLSRGANRFSIIGVTTSAVSVFRAGSFTTITFRFHNLHVRGGISIFRTTRFILRGLINFRF